MRLGKHRDPKSIQQHSPTWYRINRANGLNGKREAKALHMHSLDTSNFDSWTVRSKESISSRGSDLNSWDVESNVLKPESDRYFHFQISESSHSENSNEKNSKIKHIIQKRTHSNEVKSAAHELPSFQVHMPSPDYDAKPKKVALISEENKVDVAAAPLITVVRKDDRTDDVPKSNHSVISLDNDAAEPGEHFFHFGENVTERISHEDAFDQQQTFRAESQTSEDEAVNSLIDIVNYHRMNPSVIETETSLQKIHSIDSDNKNGEERNDNTKDQTKTLQTQSPSPESNCEQTQVQNNVESPGLAIDPINEFFIDNSKHQDTYNGRLQYNESQEIPKALSEAPSNSIQGNREHSKIDTSDPVSKSMLNEVLRIDAAQLVKSKNGLKRTNNAESEIDQETRPTEELQLREQNTIRMALVHTIQATNRARSEMQESNTFSLSQKDLENAYNSLKPVSKKGLAGFPKTKKSNNVSQINEVAKSNESMDGKLMAPSQKKSRHHKSTFSEKEVIVIDLQKDDDPVSQNVIGEDVKNKIQIFNTSEPDNKPQGTSVYEILNRFAEHGEIFHPKNDEAISTDSVSIIPTTDDHSNTPDILENQHKIDKTKPKIPYWKTLKSSHFHWSVKIQKSAIEEVTKKPKLVTVKANGSKNVTVIHRGKVPDNGPEKNVSNEGMESFQNISEKENISPLSIEDNDVLHENGDEITKRNSENNQMNDHSNHHNVGDEDIEYMNRFKEARTFFLEPATPKPKEGSADYIDEGYSLYTSIHNGKLTVLPESYV